MAYSATDNQLTHVLQRFYRRVGGKATLATGGGTTTAIDTKLTEELQQANVDDLYNGGTIIVIEDAGGANAAPEGQISRVTDYEASSTTITFSPAVTAAIATGDRILVAPRDFPLYDVIELVNDALSSLGEIPRVDTSLTTAANQTEYALPVALKGRQLLNVEIQGITTDSNDNRYREVPGWKIRDALPGSTGLLILPQYAAGYTLKITYMGKHPRVDLYDDYISEYFHPDLVHAAVMAAALQWRNDSDRVVGGADEQLLALEQKAQDQLRLAKVEHKVTIPPRRVGGGLHWMTDAPRDEFAPIPLP